MGIWQAIDEELGSLWSPDGKYLSIWGRNHKDYSQESIFMIRIPSD